MDTAQPQKKQEKYPNLNVGGPGRKEKYDSSMVQKAYEYLEMTMTAKNDFPSIDGFAYFLGVDDTSILGWANKKIKDQDGKLTKQLARPDFFAAVKRIKRCQKIKLMRDGFYMGKKVNANMAIFLLKVNHKMVEVSKHELVGKDGKPLIPVPILGGVSDVPTDKRNP